MAFVSIQARSPFVYHQINPKISLSMCLRTSDDSFSGLVTHDLGAAGRLMGM